MNVPKLRFKNAEGADFPLWTMSKLGNEVQFSKGGKLGKSDLQKEGSHQCLLYGELYTSYGSIASKIFSRTDTDSDTTSQKYDVVMPTSGETAEDIATATCIPFDGILYGGDLIILRSQTLYGPFLSYQINSSLKRKISRVAQGKSVVHIGAEKIKPISFSFPCLEEQQKIASFFSTLDQKIELNERKLEALEELKKGLMQKIFNREIRFKQEDGSDFPKWNNKRLGEVACLNNGRAYKQEELLNEGKYIVLRVGNFFTNEKFYYSNMELESCKYAHKGDLLYCWSASFGPKIWGGEKVIYHYHIWKIDPINIDKNYLYYYLQRDVENLEQEMNGGTMMHLTKSNMELRSIEIPVIEEQTKIASLFIHFDKKIELVLAKINSLKNLKQGFMQQMFV